jgi:hypothetical protein
VRLAALSVGLAAVGVLALLVNFVGAAGGHCDASCSGNFPRWLYVASGWVVVLCVALLIALAAAGIVRRLRA